MKILCITCMYNRPQVSELFLVGMKRLGIPVLAAVTGDESVEVCRGFDSVRFFEYKNKPVGDKWNAVINMAKTDPTWTHLMISGDDNLYSDAVIGLYQAAVDQGHHLSGFRNLYFVEPSTKRAIRFEYEKDIPKTIGAGRLLSRGLVEKTLSRYQMWDGTKNHHLDYDMDMRALEFGVPHNVLDRDSVHVIDVKTEQNIWKFSKFNILDQVSIDEALSVISDDEKEKLLCIKSMESNLKL